MERLVWAGVLALALMAAGFPLDSARAAEKGGKKSDKNKTVEAPPIHANDARIEIQSWFLEYIWKDAHSMNRHHGIAKLRNAGEEDLSEVRIRLAVFDLDGGKPEAEGEWVTIGNLPGGESAEKEFNIEPSVEFEEAVLRVSYKHDGRTREEIFTLMGPLQKGVEPNPVLLGDNRLMLRARKIETGNNAKKCEAVFRIQNLSEGEADQIKIEFTAFTERKKGDTPETVTLTFDKEKPLASGEVRTLKKSFSLKNNFTGRYENVKISSRFAAPTDDEEE